MSRVHLLLLGVVLAFAVPVSAANWELTARISESLSFDTNPDLEVDENELSFGSTTSAGLTLSAAQGRNRFVASTGLNATFFTNQDSGDDLNGIRPNLTLRYIRSGTTWNWNTSASFDIRPSDFTDFRDVLLQPDPEDPDLTDPPAPTDPILDTVEIEDATDRIDIRAASNLSLSMTPRDTLTFGVSASATRFAESVPGVSTSENFGGSFSYSRALSPISSGGFTASVLRFSSEEQEAPGSTEGYSFSIAGNYATSMTPRTSVSTSLGLSFTTRTDEDLIADVLVETDDTDIGFTGGFGLTYAVQRRQLGLNVSQGVRPSTTGDTRNVTSFAASYREVLSDRLSLSVGTAYILESDVGFTGEVDQRYTFTTGLTYDLSRNWDASLTYQFRGEKDDDSDGTAISNRISLSLSRNFNLLR